MKICMLGMKRVPSREGGVEVVVEELAVRMVALGNSVVCLNRSGHHVSGPEFDSKRTKFYKGIQIKTMPTPRRGPLAALVTSVIGTIYAMLVRPDVIHFHAEGSCGMIWLPKMLGMRCVVTIHGLDYQRPKWGMIASKYLKYCESMAAKFADEIIVLSKNNQKYFLDEYNRTTHYIPNGVVAPEVMDANLIINRFNLKKDDYVLFLARITPEKGVERLIEEWGRVNSNKTLVIAGGASDSGEYLARMKSLAQSDSRIVFTGFVQGDLLAELYSNAYVYVLPSFIEGMPLSLLEAMSYGNCCLGSSIPEITDVMKSNGLTFDTDDDLRSQLQLLCDHKEMVDEYRKNVSEYVINNYSWDKICKRTLSIYKAEI